MFSLAAIVFAGDLILPPSRPKATAAGFFGDFEIFIWTIYEPIGKMATMNFNLLAEEQIMERVRSGHIRIDEAGRCWRRDNGARAEAPCGKGYFKLRFQCHRIRYHAQAHRIVFRHFGGVIPPGCTINHKDGNPGNNHPDNLEPATMIEQMSHAKQVLHRIMGAKPGALNHQAKLKPKDVAAIRRRRSAGEKLNAIAKDFGIAFQQVSRIAAGLRWRTLK
jgi:hypothetical protein